MSWPFSGTDTGFTVSCDFIWKGEFTQISPDHIELHFNGGEHSSCVTSNNAANHIGHNDTVTKMGLHNWWLLSRNTVLLWLITFHIESVISVLYFYHIIINYFLRIFFFVELWTIQRFSMSSTHQFVQGCNLWMNISEYPFTFLQVSSLWLININILYQYYSLFYTSNY